MSASRSTTLGASVVERSNESASGALIAPEYDFIIQNLEANKNMWNEMEEQEKKFGEDKMKAVKATGKSLDSSI